MQASSIYEQTSQGNLTVKPNAFTIPQCGHVPPNPSAMLSNNQVDTPLSCLMSQKPCLVCLQHYCRLIDDLPTTSHKTTQISSLQNAGNKVMRCIMSSKAGIDIRFMCVMWCFYHGWRTIPHGIWRDDLNPEQWIFSVQHAPIPVNVCDWVDGWIKEGTNIVSFRTRVLRGRLERELSQGEPEFKIEKEDALAKIIPYLERQSSRDIVTIGALHDHLLLELILHGVLPFTQPEAQPEAQLGAQLGA